MSELGVGHPQRRAAAKGALVSSYVPALGLRVLTRFYEPVVRYTMRDDASIRFTSPAIGRATSASLMRVI